MSQRVTGEPIIQLTDVIKTYGSGQGRQQVLRGVTLSLARGEMVALLGQSGSGKSTLLNVIGGLDRADAGSVLLFGKDAAKLDDHELSRLRSEHIGFVFQSFHLLDHLTCVENVSLPAFFSREYASQAKADARAVEALARVGLEAYARRRPPELSGGQKQRVAIARALFHRPSLLLCDEPTGSLDSDTGQDVISFFQELNHKDGVTMLLVTHEERVSQAARRVIRIRDGVLATEVAAA
jgi:putative ABC transport system ATP-binding protein